MAVKKKTQVKKTPVNTKVSAIVSKEKPVEGSRIFKSDIKETNTLVRAARFATAHAIRSLKALDLPVTYMEKGIVYRKNADGTIESLTSLPSPKKTNSKAAITLKKGMILHAKKN